LITEKSPVLKILLLLIMILSGVQSMMTFSRGGMYNAIGAAFIACLFLLRDRQAALRILVVGTLICTLGYFVLLPKMDALTDGALTARFQDTDTTNRMDFILVELQVWRDNPILGVGPDQARGNRAETLGKAAAAHTEFSRMLAEHGTFGLLALLMLIGAGTWNLWKAKGAQHKALVAAAMVWSFLFMTNAAMRIVAPAFMFGLAFIGLVSDKQLSLETLRRRRKPGIRRKLKSVRRSTESAAS
jgi:O-antigen ligase